MNNNVILQIPNGFFQSISEASSQISAFLSAHPYWEISECSEEFLILDGYVPMVIKGMQFSTPLQIFLNRSFPTVPPSCIVIKQNNTNICLNHKNVDLDGIVYMPYLSEWNSFSNLVQLFQKITEVFNRNPPLYASEENFDFNEHDDKHVINGKKAGLNVMVSPSLESCKNILEKKIEQGVEIIYDSYRKRIIGIKEKKEELERAYLKINKDMKEFDARKAILNRENNEMEHYLESVERFSENFNQNSLLSFTDDLSKLMVFYTSRDRAITDCITILKKNIEMNKIPIRDVVDVMGKLFKLQFEQRQAITHILKEQSNSHAKSVQ